MRSDSLVQLFVERKGAGYELLLVLESAAGARQRVRVAAPPTVASDERGAVDHLARWMRSRGVRLAKSFRVRHDAGGELVDAPELKARLTRLVGRAGGPDRGGEG